ncbi:MAG: hypothetical protein ABL958_02060 [Bdellovibrionia bacterium]
MVVRRFIAASLAALIATPAQASLPIGGSCSMMGAWTIKALNASSELQDVLRRLQNDKACAGIQGSIVNLQKMKNILGTRDQNAGPAARFEALPSEMSAIRDVIGSNPQASPELMPALASRANEAGELTAAAGQRQEMILDVATLLKDRAVKVTAAGLGMMESVFNELPKYDQCLAAHPADGLLIVGAALNMAAAFSANSEGVTSSLARANGSLITMLRNRKFTKILRGLEYTQLRTQLSCMIETLSQNYCSAYDARSMLQINMDALNAKDNQLDLNSPFAGYYILTRPVPKITNWIQDILMGITPKLSTDATFKNEVWSTVTDTIQTVNQMWGMYYHNKNYMNKIKGEGEETLIAKRVHVFSLIRDLSEYLSKSVGKHNFFTKSVTVKLLPWYMIGRNELPKSVQGSESGGTFVQDGLTAMEGDGKTFTPEFADPEKLHGVIKQRLELLGERAIEMAQAYFRQYIVVDVGNLVSQTIADPNYTVQESLTAVKKYLDALEAQVRSAVAKGQSGADSSVLPHIVETRGRIEELLESFENAKQLEKTLPDIKLPSLKDIIKEPTAAGAIDPGAIEDYKEKVAAVYTRVIDLIFTNFNVLKQRDSFLINRMTSLVKLDYALKIRNGVDLNKYAKELYSVSDNKILETIIALHGNSGTTAKLDLDTALDQNLRNLNAFETAFSDVFERILIVKGMQARNEQPTPLKINLELLRRLEAEAKKDTKKFFGSTPIVSVTMNFLLGGQVQGFNTWRRYLGKPDLYHMEPISLRAPPVSKDENGSIEQLRAQLCAQTLAFQNWPRFHDYCKGSVLRGTFTPIKDEGRGVEFDLKYDDYTAKTISGERYRGDVMSARICAVRDYSRKHYVFWLNQLSGGRR